MFGANSRIATEKVSVALNLSLPFPPRTSSITFAQRRYRLVLLGSFSFLRTQSTTHCSNAEMLKICWVASRCLFSRWCNPSITPRCKVDGPEGANTSSMCVGSSLRRSRLSVFKSFVGIDFHCSRRPYCHEWTSTQPHTVSITCVLWAAEYGSPPALVGSNVSRRTRNVPGVCTVPLAMPLGGRASSSLDPSSSVVMMSVTI
jgi:hypothetical protein